MVMTTFYDSLYNNFVLDKSDDPPIFDPRGQTQTVFKVQLYVCTTLGILLFFIFCFVRSRFPLIFSIRPYKNSKIKHLPDDMFSWIKILISINNEQLLQVVGLDAYVFLCFFKMSIKILLCLSLLGLFILSPLRYFLTGSFDKDNNFINVLKKKSGNHPDQDSEPFSYLFICTVFTYFFTAIIYYFLYKETLHIIKIRQRFLGSQRSITDRTIFISNIPENLRDETDLKNHIEKLGVGKVDQISFVHDYTPLVILFEKRIKIIQKLEILYSKHCGLAIKLISKDDEGPFTFIKTLKSKVPPKPNEIVYKPMMDDNQTSIVEDEPQIFPILTNLKGKSKPLGRIHWWPMGQKIDLFDHYIRQLVQIDQDIKDCKENDGDKFNFKIIPHAFVTMDSVSDAQMAAQAVFSPKVFELITCLAPAPLDIDWQNLLMSTKTIFLRKNLLEIVIIAFSMLLIIPIRYISSLLNVSSIKKIWSEFGEYLIKHEKVRTLVTGLLPTYLFTLINVALPYVISFLSSLQGLSSKGDVELSVIKKNFLYIFFNLFLVFTLFGTLSSYKALLSDTTKIAPLLATSIKSLSLFYIDLILLQGLTMFPFKLLQFGDLAMIFWDCTFRFGSQTPRSYRELFYKPATFDLGLILPQHIMILIITMIYSAISTKILVSGLVYFVLGFYTYKYQLVYSMVHPYHSTGKAWPIIFKRVCLGLFFLHLQMFGALALEQSFILAGLIVPLFPTTIIALMFFDRHYRPLLNYIALDAIKTRGRSVESEDTEDLEGFLGSSTVKGINRKSSVASIRKFFNIDENDAVAVEENTSSGSGSSNEESNNINNISSGVDVDNDVTTILPIANNTLNRLRKRRSTIEEEREAFQSYTHPCLLDPMDGVCVGFKGDYMDFVGYRLVSAGYNSIDPNNNTELGEIRGVVCRKKSNFEIN